GPESSLAAQLLPEGSPLWSTDNGSSEPPGGTVDIFDLIGLLRIISGAEQESPSADLDGSGAVDIFDLIELLKLISE
ncbi:unnamed protein product, partial [marine sediment metagenome]